MVSRTATKFIKSLQLKKYRKIEQLFTVEGEKSVLEVLQSSFKVQRLIGTLDFIQRHESQLTSIEVVEASEKELTALGSFKSNRGALAVVEMKPNATFKISNEYVLALDGVNDPGNLGTIIRIADWYGIKKIAASLETADLYNPKVIAASKGSFTRTQIFYTNLPEFVRSLDLPMYGAFMDGDNVHQVKFESSGVIVMGNESNGISNEMEPCITRKISIPQYGEAESLNVGVATAVICDNLARTR